MGEPAGRVPVPDTVTALYVVLTGAPIEDPGTSPPVPPVGLLLARGTDRELADRVADLSCASAVSREATVDATLENERAALGAALATASHHGGLVLDARVPRIVTSSPPARLRSADWFAFEHADENRVVRTHGLVRFGVPELGCGPVPPDQIAMYDAVLVGAAQRTVEEWPGNDPVGPATITMRDIARGYGDASAGGGDPTLARQVDVTIAYDAGEHRLDVTLHDDPATALFST